MDTNVLIVGAGLSGLVAANTLQSAGKTVTVLDKGRSTGGRLATRRIQAGLADHGAQFFTVRTDIFQAKVDEWLAEDLVYVWGHGWSDGSLKRTASDGHPRYATRGGMNQMAQALTKPLQDVRVNIKVSSVKRTADGFAVQDESGTTYTAQAVLMTAPVPQTLALLDLTLDEEDQEALERIEYGPCLCGLFVVDGDVDLPQPGAIQDFEKTVYWIADNQAKQISPGERIITLHAEARWSRQHYDAPEAENLQFFEEALTPHLKPGATITEKQLKKWRYSVPLTTYPRDFLAAQGMPLFFAGDAFGGRGRVEGAYLSGHTVAQAILEALS